MQGYCSPSGFPFWCLLLQVFMFIVNDKGTSWAYATPGFANSLNHHVLQQLRSLADVPENSKMITEVRDEQDWQ